MVAEVVDHRYLLAARDAVAQFPITVSSMEAVGVSENLTFRVRDERGRDFSLRLHRPGYNSLRELESERSWTAALAHAGLEVQQALPMHSGAQFLQLAIPGMAESRYAGMTSWLPGSLLGDYLEHCTDRQERCRRFRQIGTLAATIHNQAVQWQVPTGFSRPLLDVDGLLGEQPRWGRFWEHAALSDEDRSLLLRTRQRLRAVLAQYGMHPERFSLIHADLHPHNLLIDGDRVALIDFDDSAFGWHLYDLASALIEYVDATDFPALRQALLESYREQRPLGPDDEQLLDTFLMLRGMALIGWFHQRPEHAGSAFFEQVKTQVLAWAAASH